MAVIKDVEESEGGVFADGFVGVGVHEVPGRADVGVWDIEGGVEGLKGVEGQGAGAGFVGGVDGFVFGSVGRGYVPVEVVFEAVFVGGGGWGGERLRGRVAEGGGGGYKVRFGGGDEPCRKGLGDVRIFLSVSWISMNWTEYIDWVPRGMLERSQFLQEEADIRH